MKKTIKLIALALSLAIGLTACSGGANKATSGDKAAGGDKPKEEVTLRFSWWGGDDRHEKTLEAIKKFEEKNPGITIKAEYGGWQGHQEKVTAQMAGNTAPDILQINWNWIWIFSKDGNGFYDLNTLKDQINLANYDKALLDQTTVNGKLNAIPVGVTGKVWYYNKATYDKAGVAIPKTYDDLFAAAKEFKTKLGKEYYPLDLDQYAAFLTSIYYLEQKTGKPFMNDDYTVAYTKEELTDAFNFYGKMVKEGVVPSMEVRGAAGNVPMDQTPSWIQGKYGGTYEWDSAVPKFVAALEGEKNVVKGDFITGAGPNKSALAKISMGFAINKNTKHPEVAAKFLEFLIAEEEGVQILGTSRGIPANKKALDILKAKNMLSGLTFEGNQAALEFMGKGISPYFEHTELQALYKTTMEEFGYGKLTAEQAADKIITEVNKITKELTK